MTLPPIIAPLLRLDNQGKVQAPDESEASKKVKSGTSKKKSKTKKKV